MSVILCLCLGIYVTAQFSYPIRVRLASFDTRLTLGPEEGEFLDVAETQRVLRKRLLRAGVLARVEGEAGNAIHVQLRSEDRAAAESFLLDRGSLRVMIVAERDGDSSSPLGPGNYQRVPWSAATLRKRPGTPPLNLETAGALYLSDFAEFYRTLDGRGGYCLGFTMTDAGAKKLSALSRAHIGRELAIVIEGAIWSAPVIRSEIGRKGIVDGGERSWDPDELTRMVILFSGGEFPEPLVVLGEERLDK